MKTFFTLPRKKAFLFIPMLFFICLLMLMVLIEWEEIKSLFLIQQLEQEKNQIEREQEFLNSVIVHEIKSIETYLKDNSEKNIYQYLVETEKGESLLSKPENTLSIGGYQLEHEIPQEILYDTWKGYFVKYYEVAEQNKKCKIRFMIEYKYGKDKYVTAFLSYKIIEMEVYLL